MTLDPTTFLLSALGRGLPLDAALAGLRQHGASTVESIKAAREVQGVPLSEAKRLVSISPAWEDVRGEHERFVADIAAILEDEA